MSGDSQNHPVDGHQQGTSEIPGVPQNDGRNWH
jgi:hypothetical protein